MTIHRSKGLLVVPNTDGLRGIEAAVTAGFAVSRPEAGLQVLSVVSDEEKALVHERMDAPEQWPVRVREFGAALKPLDSETKRQLNLPNGLEVVAVKKGKMADAGVEKGWIILQVNDRPMNTMEDFEEAVKEANRSSDRILWIRAVTQSGRLRSAVVELDEK